jgi:hypothetical protein
MSLTGDFHNELPKEYQELFSTIAKSIGKKLGIEDHWYEVHLTTVPKDTVIIRPGHKVDIICGYDIMHEDIIEILTRAMKRVPGNRLRYDLIVRDTVLVSESGKKRYSRRKGDINDLIPVALPKDRLRYVVHTTKEIIGIDIATGNRSSVVCNMEDENTTEEEMLLRVRIQLGIMCGYGDNEV